MICLEQSFIQGAGIVSSSQKLSLAIIWQLTEIQVCNSRGGVNWNFNKYAIQFAQQFNLLP